MNAEPDSQQEPEGSKPEGEPNSKIDRLFWVPDLDQKGDPTGARHRLSLQESPTSSWCFPLAHLVCYCCASEQSLNLDFPTHRAEITCKNSRVLIENILKGEVTFLGISKEGSLPPELVGNGKEAVTKIAVHRNAKEYHTVYDPE